MNSIEKIHIRLSSYLSPLAKKFSSGNVSRRLSTVEALSLAIDGRRPSQYEIQSRHACRVIVHLIGDNIST
jgi:hypothetical protein